MDLVLLTIVKFERLTKKDHADQSSKSPGIMS